MGVEVWVYVLCRDGMCVGVVVGSVRWGCLCECGGGPGWDGKF